jgi:hypothetical protein
LLRDPAWFSLRRSAVFRDFRGMPIPIGNSSCPSYRDRVACRHSGQSTTQDVSCLRIVG